MANRELTKIYRLETIGGQSALEQLHAINKAFIEIATTKRALNQQRGSVEDPAELKKIDAALADLTKRHQDMVKEARNYQSVIKEEQIAKSKAVKDNEALAGSYDQLKQKYEELLAIAKGTVSISDPAEVQAAATELGQLKAQLDGFNTSLKEGTTAAKQHSTDLDEVMQSQEGVSAAILAGRQAEEQAANSTANRTATLEQLAAAEEATREEVAAASEAMKGFGRTTLEVAGQTEPMEAETLRLSERILVLKDEATRVSEEMKKLTSSYESGAISTQQYREKGAELLDQQMAIRTELQQSTAELKTQAQVQLASANSINEYRAKVSQLTKERNNLNLLTAQGTVRQHELNAEIDKYNNLIRQNVDNYQKQKINIGNYPNATAELKALRAEMEKLVLAGEQDSAEFKTMSARAKELSGAMGQVKDATKETEEHTGQLERQLGHMGVSFVAQMAIFQVATYIIKQVGDAIDEMTGSLSKAEHEAEKAYDSLSKIRQDLDKQKQALASQNFVNDPNNDPEVKKLKLQLDVLKSQQETGKNALKDKEANVALDKEIYNLEQNINQKVLEKYNLSRTFVANTRVTTQFQRSAQILLLRELDDKIAETRAAIQIAENTFKRQQGDKYNPYKAPPKPKDFTNEELAADRFNIEQKGKLREADYRIDLEQQRLIYENVKVSLDKRLQAYEEYANDLKLIAIQDKDAQIQATQAALAKIGEIKKKQAGGGKITPAQKRLLDQEQGYLDEVERLNKEKTAALAKIDADAHTARVGIIKADVQEILHGIDKIKEDAAVKSNEQLIALNKSYQDGEISFKKYKEKEKILADEAHIYELNLVKKYLQAQIEAFEAAGRDATELKNALSKVNVELISATNDLNQDLNKKKFDIQKFYAELKNTAAEAFKTIADSYIDNENRKIDRDIESAKKAQDIEKQKRLDQASSAAEKAAIEKEFDQKADQLERERFERHKKQAEAQLEVEFAVASIKALNAGFDSGGIYGALAAEALVAFEYAAKYAALENATYGQGGDLKKVLGGGGIFSGPSHTAGGIGFTFGGLPREVEGNEGYVINKGSMASGGVYTVTGTPAQIASAANVTGGGVNFAPGASFGYGGTLGAGLTAPYFTPASSGGGDAIMAMLATVQQLAANQAATNQRIDNLRVTLNPHAVSEAQDRQAKLIKMTTL